jgi:hypothetical protein
MQAAQDKAVARSVEQGEREALVATRVLERIEPDETHVLERAPGVRLQDGRAGGQLIELGGDGVHLVQMGVEDGLEAPPTLAPGQSFDPAPELADPPSLEQGDQEQDDDGENERADEGTDVRFDEGVEIDGRAPPTGTAGV